MNWSNPLAAGFSAGGSLLGGFFSSVYNKHLIKSQQKYNTSERLASQDWQDRQRVAQNRFSENMYNKYSSPAAIAAQYRDAGFNPGLAMNGDSVGSVQASSGSSGSAPNGAMGSMPYMQAPDFTQGFINMANVLKSIAEAKQAGVQTDYMERIADDNARLIKTQADAAEFKLQLDLKYGDAERLAALLNTKSLYEVNSRQAKNLEKDYEILCQKLKIDKFEADHIWDRYFWYEQQQITDVGQGQANVKYTEASTLLAQANERLAKAQAFTESKKPALLEAYTKVQNAVAEFKEFDNSQRRQNKDVISQDNFASITMHTRTVFKTYEYLTQALENAIKDGELKDVQFYRDLISTIAPLLQFGLQGLGGPSTPTMNKIGFAP